MLNSSILKKIAPIFMLGIFFISCDKDFNEIGTDIVGENHFGFEKDSSATVLAFSKKTGVVETTNLPVNPLGVFENGKFGKTTASFVTQVTLASYNPKFVNVDLDRVVSVVLKVPYFNTLKETNTDGSSTYELDSIYGNVSAPIRLKIYENGYYLRDFNPGTNFTQQKFYSDQGTTFDGLKIGTDTNGNAVVSGQPLNVGVDNQDDNFKFLADEIISPGEDEDDEDVREAPAMRIGLNTAYFFKKIIQADASKLVNENVFKEYFKGLYFKVEQIENSGALTMLDFSKGTITINYIDDVVSTVAGVTTTTATDKKLILNLKGNTVSLQEHTATAASNDYETATGNESTGDSKLYLKGGNGSVAFIDLFGGGNSAELEELRATALANNWLINEAYIAFNVEQNDMAETVDPNRIYLYDATNRRAIVDYVYDTSTNSSKPKYSKSTHGGIAELTGASGDNNRKAKRYKIRITEHVKNVIFKDSTNIRLGVSVTETIANSSNLALKNVTPEFRSVPFSSVMSPLGTIITGSNQAASNPKKLRLVITFTKPD